MRIPYTKAVTSLVMVVLSTAVAFGVKKIMSARKKARSVTEPETQNDASASKPAADAAVDVTEPSDENEAQDAVNGSIPADGGSAVMDSEAVSEMENVIVQAFSSEDAAASCDEATKEGE